MLKGCMENHFHFFLSRSRLRMHVGLDFGTDSGFNLARNSLQATRRISIRQRKPVRTMLKTDITPASISSPRHVSQVATSFA